MAVDAPLHGLFEPSGSRFCLSRRNADRVKLARFLQELADNPFQEGLEFVHDSTGRRNEVLDEVKVLKIEVLKPRL